MMADTQHGAVAIQVRVRLIEDPQRCAGEHHPREREATSLAGRQRRGELVAGMRDAEVRERRFDFAGAQRPPQSRLEGEVLVRGEFGLQAVAVGEITERRAPGVAVGIGVAPVAGHLSLLRPQQSRDHPQERRLAGAVRPQHVDALPGRSLERDAREHPPLAAPDLDASDGNSRKIRRLQG